MVIIHSDREGITNFNLVQTIGLYGRYIHATMSDDKRRIIGVYKSDVRAGEVFGDMLNAIMSDEIPKKSWYSMPEE